ncbi:MAG TPA: DUF58 domain-containing protein [Rhodothermales bacterium]|nr:DUF58 domain-containing protein [Rhodothermales bacterium]
MMQAATRFIQPDVLSRISNLELLARGVVEGFVAGLHRSPYKGFSVDFMEYRPYMPGDDLMHVDWKLYARSDRYYVKEFEDETNTRLNLLVDISHSMGYTSAGVTKLDYAFYLAASLAYLMVRQRDAVGLTLFDDKVLTRIPPRSTKGHLNLLLTEMERAELGQHTALGKPLHDLAEQQRKRGLVVLISDLLDDPAALIDGLQHFRFKGHEVMVFHLMDPQEMRFEFNDIVEFEDMETGEKMLIEAETAKELYLENLNHFQNRLRKECGLLGVDYSVLTTDQPLDFALFNYLAARKRK